MRKIPNERFFSWIEEEIAEGHSVRFRLKGCSMFPLLRDGRDEVVLYPCTDEELRVMDVVLFKYNGTHTLHRIIRRDGSRLYMRGDGSFIAREQCEVADVIGKVRFVIRPSGRVLSVNDWRWRLPSMLWQKTGIFRNPLLRILHRLVKCNSLFLIR